MQLITNPRFYFDIPSWATSVGLGYDDQEEHPGTGFNKVFGLDATKPFISDTGMYGDAFTEYRYRFRWNCNIPIDYFAILGHKFLNDSPQFNKIQTRFINDFTDETNYYPLGELDHEDLNGIPVNWPDNRIEGSSWDTMLNGWSLGFFNGGCWAPDNYGNGKYTSCSFKLLDVSSSIMVGRVTFGPTFTFPRSPTKMTMERQIQNVKHQVNPGGHDFVHIENDDHLYWGDAPAWEQYNQYEYLTHITPNIRAGKRKWTITFDAISSAEMFGPTLSLNDRGWSGELMDNWVNSGYAEMPDAEDYYYDNVVDGLQFNSNLLTDNNVFSRCIQLTNGGQLPFIMQINKDNFNNDQWAIVKFDNMKKFKLTQTANSVWSLTLKLKEI